MTSDVYIYAEPDLETRDVYLDQDGEPHLDREAAIAANIMRDLERELRVQIARAFPDQGEERAFVARVIAFAIRGKRTPLGAMVRALIESTD